MEIIFCSLIQWYTLAFNNVFNLVTSSLKDTEEILKSPEKSTKLIKGMDTSKRGTIKMTRII